MPPARFVFDEVCEPENPPPDAGDDDSRPSIASPLLCMFPPRFTRVVRSESARLEEGLVRLEEDEPQTGREEEELLLLPPEKTGRETREEPDERPKPPPRPPRASLSSAGQTMSSENANNAMR